MVNPACLPRQKTEPCHGRELPAWGEEKRGESVIQGEERSSSFRYPVNHQINKKLTIWEFGDITSLKVDALVNPTCPNMLKQTPLFMAAGKSLPMEIQLMNGKDNLVTGHSLSTRPCRLHCKRLFHTAPPKYEERYAMAARNSLHRCYLNSFAPLACLACTSVTVSLRRRPPTLPFAQLGSFCSGTAPASTWSCLWCRPRLMWSTTGGLSHSTSRAPRKRPAKARRSLRMSR